MTNRRDFMRYTAAAAIAGSRPVSAMAARETPIATRRIPGTEESLPIIGLGNSAAFRADDLRAARGLIEIFVDRGGKYIDAGDSSRFNVGRIAMDLGASGTVFIGNYLEPQDATSLSDAARTVARAQGKTVLDLVQARDPVAYREHVDALHSLKDEGLTRYLGVARSGEDYFDSIMAIIDDGLVDFVQVNYSMIEPKAAERLLPLALEKGVAVCINRPFINGRYFELVKDKPLPEWAADFDCESWAQFSLKYILAHPAVNCVLTETSNPRHAIDNLGAGIGRLPDAATRERMLALMQTMM